jgi:hypothetical protein
MKSSRAYYGERPRSGITAKTKKNLNNFLFMLYKNKTAKQKIEKRESENFLVILIKLSIWEFI